MKAGKILVRALILEAIDAPTLANTVNSDSRILVVDARRPGEYSAEHVDGAMHSPLSF